MHKPTKYIDKGITLAAGAAWNAFQFFNQFKPNGTFTPKWSDKPLLKSHQKTKPTLGWPRTTDSLCPVCVREARQRIHSPSGMFDASVAELGRDRSELQAPVQHEQR